MCKYNGCTEKPLNGSEYCALHIDFEEGEKLFGEEKLREIKEKALQEKIEKGDFNFIGVKLYDLQIDLLSKCMSTDTSVLIATIPSMIAGSVTPRGTPRTGRSLRLKKVDAPTLSINIKNSTILGKVSIKNNVEEYLNEEIQRRLSEGRDVTFRNFSIDVKIEDSSISELLIIRQFKGSVRIYSQEAETRIGGIKLENSNLSALTLEGGPNQPVIVRSGIYVENCKIHEVDILNSHIKQESSNKPAFLKIKNSQIGNFFVNWVEQKDKRTIIEGYLIIEDTSIGEVTNASPSVVIENLIANGIEIASRSADDRKRIKLDVRISNSKIRDLIFKNLKVQEGDVYLTNNEITGIVTFPNTTILGDVKFDKCRFTGEVLREGGKYVSLDIIDIRKFSHLDFDIKGRLTFYGSTFKDPYLEEIMCRKARRVLENIGDREGADDHFYREMKARRKQKQSRARKFFEWLIADLTCQYGTNWKRPLVGWIGFVLVIFPILYVASSAVNGSSALIYNNDSSAVLVFGTTSDNLLSLLRVEYFSIVTATTLGYGDMQPLGLAKVFASIEAIFGMLMWAIFLAVFTRKYMR